jgi:hypothetical protein
MVLKPEVIQLGDLFWLPDAVLFSDIAVEQGKVIFETRIQAEDS